MTGYPADRGVTLVELVVTLVLVAIIAAMVTTFLARPMQGFMDQTRRAELTDQAALALLRMSRDVRAALPNSVRTSGGTALELLLTVDGDRYRSENDPPGGPEDRLDIASPDELFNVFGPLRGLGGQQRLAIHPLDQPGADPYSDPVMTDAFDIAGSISTVAGPGGGDDETRVDMPTHTFPLESPGRRIYVVDGPVSYICDGGELLRFDGYQPGGTQPDSPGDFPGGGALVVENIDRCDFRYEVIDATQRNALAILLLELRDEGETVALQRQVHVNNSP